MTEIRTDRLLLRRARARDLDATHAIMSDERATRFWSTPPHTDREQTWEWLKSMIEAPSEESDDFVVGLDGRVIGKAGCWRLPEIGFILHPDHWGQGYAREALAAVIAHIFGRHAIAADVDPRNEASLALLAGLGFEKTGAAERTYFIAAEWHDSIYLELRRPEGA